MMVRVVKKLIFCGPVDIVLNLILQKKNTLQGPVFRFYFTCKFSCFVRTAMNSKDKIQQ